MINYRHSQPSVVAHPRELMVGCSMGCGVGMAEFKITVGHSQFPTTFANFRTLVLHHKSMLSCSWQLIKTTNTCFNNLWPILLSHNTTTANDWPSNFQNGLILCKVFGHLSKHFPHLILNSGMVWESHIHTHVQTHMHKHVHKNTHIC